MNTAKKLLRNTLLLTLVSFLMRTISVSFNVYLTNQIGATGIGLFQLVMTVYALATTLGSAGIRLATTRVTVQANTQQTDSRQVVRRCVGYAVCTGTLAACLLLLCADMASLHWLNDARTAGPLRILALSLPFIAVSSSLGGYFTAVRKIPQSAFIQLLEQGIKICITVAALKRVGAGDLEAACRAMVIGITAAEVASCSMSAGYYTYSKRRLPHNSRRASGVLRRIIRIAVPDAVGASMRSVLLTIEHLLIPSGLRKSGSSAKESLAAYGAIHGMALPLVLYPSAILTSLSGLLVPEIAECHERGDEQRIQAMTARVLRITVLFGLGTAGILYVFADSLSHAVYGSAICTQYLRLLAPLVPVMYLDMSVDGILKGLDQQMYVMRYNICDSALCVVLVYFLLPRYAVQGYVIILYVSEVLNFYCSLRRLIQVSYVKVNVFTSILQPIPCILGAFYVVRLLFSGVAQALNLTGALVLLIGCTAGLYFLFLRLVGSITAEDTRWLRGVLVR